MHHRSSSMSRSMGLLRLKAILALTPSLSVDAFKQPRYIPKMLTMC
jgi:hypothetical protein